MRRQARLGKVFLRSFGIQGSWNFETLLGYGFAYALLPALRAVYRDRPRELEAALARHAGLFNSHPYMAPVALGAVARLEVEGRPPEVIERFKAAVRGALGGLGDRMIWAGWRPVCVLSALALFLAGAPWWIAVLLFLLVYNAGHVALRVWAFRLGWREGTGIAAALKAPWIRTLERVLHRVGSLLLGVCIVLAANGPGRHLAALQGAWIPAALLAAGVGLVMGARVRRPLEVVLLGLLGFGFIWSTT